MKKHVKLLSLALLIVIVLCSLSFTSCTSKEEQSKEEQTKIALTLENVEQYLTIDDEILDYNIDVEYENIYGFRIPNYDDSYGKAKIVINKKSSNLSFEDVRLNLRVSVDANYPYPWQFKNNNSIENKEFNGKVYKDSFENCTYLDLTIPYTGEYSKNLDLIIGRNEDSKSVLYTSNLTYLSIKIISVSGYVIEK